MNKRILFGMLFMLVFGLQTKASVSQRTLHEGWRFHQGGSECWHPATVPGTVHTDLMRAKVIDDPFFRLNEQSVQWIDKHDWCYENHFTPTAEELAATNQEIVFTGIDTYGDIYLNGTQLVSTNNMHRTWVCNVKGLLKEGDNKLEVYFHNPIQPGIKKFDSLPYRHNTGPDQSWIGGIFDKTISPFHRTASFEYGWDWGPRFVTFGIWRPVYLRTWTDGRINDVWFQQKTVTKSAASLTTVVEFFSDRPQTDARVRITADGRQVASKSVDLVKGLNKITLDYTIRHPKLWWTNGLGEPALTDFQTTVSVGDRQIDNDAQRIGLRSIKLHNDKDKYGHNLYFELNGVPVFAKGANMIPNDNFLSRCTDSIYRKVVQDCKDVNMNMIRVWGGGIYEDDAFYRYCDEMGILVWQDFMFACCTYEVDDEFNENVRQEAIDNVRRLRNHACIAMYAGNNECEDVMWGWGNKKASLDEEGGYGDHVWQMQRRLFYETLPEVVKEYGGGTAYRPSSPWASEAAPSNGVDGDDHYWGVWHGGKPFEDYFDHHVRFQSEYGFQSFPEYESVLQFAPDTADHHLYGEVMMAHQKAGTYANHRIEEYMHRDYPVPTDFEQFLYVSQLMQGDGVKMGMEAFRRDRPYCMGTLYWQVNDCWPVASWSSRDYYGRWKALHYFARKAYDDILVSPRVKHADAKALANEQTRALPGAETSTTGEAKVNGSGELVLELKLVSDRLKACKGTMRIQTLTLDGKTVYDKKTALKMPANTAISVGTYPVEKLLAGHQPEDVIFYITYSTGDKTYYNIAYAARQKDMHFTRPNIHSRITPAGDGYDVTLRSDVFARGVFMKIKGIDNFFSDNYFDMLPGEERTIHVQSDKSLTDFRNEFSILTLADVRP